MLEEKSRASPRLAACAVLGPEVVCTPRLLSRAAAMQPRAEVFPLHHASCEEEQPQRPRDMASSSPKPLTGSGPMPQCRCEHSGAGSAHLTGNGAKLLTALSGGFAIPKLGPDIPLLFASPHLCPQSDSSPSGKGGIIVHAEQRWHEVSVAPPHL